MPKEEWGVKRVCPTTGKRFYDLNKDPVVSPYTGEIVNLDTGKGRTLVADKSDAKSEPQAEEALVEGEDVLDDADTDLDLGDDVLDDDADDEEVSLEEIADVASEDDDS